MRVEIFFLDNVGPPYLCKKKNIKLNIKKVNVKGSNWKKKLMEQKKEKGFNLSPDLTIQSLMFARKRDQYLSIIQTQSL
jgi:hypothetical protein